MKLNLIVLCLILFTACNSTSGQNRPKLEEGIEVEYYANGNIKVKNVSDEANKSLKVYRYREDNSLIYEAEYIDDILQWNKAYHENGLLASEKRMYNNLVGGITVYYDELGNMKVIRVGKFNNEETYDITYQNSKPSTVDFKSRKVSLE